MTAIVEDDYPKGHPARCDYDPASPEAREWARLNIHPRGERDFPVGHPKAVDTPGNTNATVWVAGVDPKHTELEAFSGRTPAQVEGLRAVYAERAALAQPTPVRKPIDAHAFNSAYQAKCEQLGVRELSIQQYNELLTTLGQQA